MEGLQGDGAVETLYDVECGEDDRFDELASEDVGLAIAGERDEGRGEMKWVNAENRGLRSMRVGRGRGMD